MTPPRPEQPATAAGRDLMVKYGLLADSIYRKDPLMVQLLTESILAIEREAAEQERAQQIAVRKDYGSLPHGEFWQKYGKGLSRELYLLPTNCTCRECQMWSS